MTSQIPRTLLAALLLVACTTTKEVARQVEVQDHTQATEHVAAQTEKATTVTTVAGPISTSEEEDLVIPPGAVIETPAGRVQLPATGAPAHIFRRAKASEGPVRTEEAQKTTTQKTDELVKDQVVATQVKEKSKTVSKWTGFGWRFWLGVLLLGGAAIAVLRFVFKIYFPWSRS